MNDTTLNIQNRNQVYSANSELSQNHLLEQYKLYIEMADRVSARRSSTNILFLTLNSMILTAFSFLFEKAPMVIPQWLICLPIGGVVMFNLVWCMLILSYKRLNTAKYSIIVQIEQNLPINPYDKEWKWLDPGNNIKKHLPFTVLEKYIPIGFILMYITLAYYLLTI